MVLIDVSIGAKGSVIESSTDANAKNSNPF